MSNMITTIIVAIVALMGLVNANLIYGNNLTISNVSESAADCYPGGQHWEHIGHWQEIYDALQISGVMRVNSIPAGYHVRCAYRALIVISNTNQVFAWQISDNIPLGGHCYVYEVGINKGHAYPGKEDYNKGLEMVYTCARGGTQNVRFVSSDGGIIAEGWVKGDPQYNSDCSGE